MTLSASLFVSSSVHEREVKLPNGEVHKLHFKELPHVEIRKFQIAEQSEHEETQAASLAKLIASSLCEPDGKPAITEKKAKELNFAATQAIVAAILEVNGFGAKNA